MAQPNGFAGNVATQTTGPTVNCNIVGGGTHSVTLLGVSSSETVPAGMGVVGAIIGSTYYAAPATWIA